MGAVRARGWAPRGRIAVRQWNGSAMVARQWNGGTAVGWGGGSYGGGGRGACGSGGDRDGIDVIGGRGGGSTRSCGGGVTAAAVGLLPRSYLSSHSGGSSLLSFFK